MYYKCSCGNIWSVGSANNTDVKYESIKIDVARRDRCPLHPNRMGTPITKQEKRDTLRNYGLAVGDISERRHGFYGQGGGGKVLAHKVNLQ